MRKEESTKEIEKASPKMETKQVTWQIVTTTRTKGQLTTMTKGQLTMMTKLRLPISLWIHWVVLLGTEKVSLLFLLLFFSLILFLHFVSPFSSLLLIYVYTRNVSLNTHASICIYVSCIERYQLYSSAVSSSSLSLSPSSLHPPPFLLPVSH